MHKRMNVRTTGLGGVCRNAGVRQRNECRRKACKMRRGGSKDRPSDLLRLPAPTAFLRLVRVTALLPFLNRESTDNCHTWGCSEDANQESDRNSLFYLNHSTTTGTYAHTRAHDRVRWRLPKCTYTLVAPVKAAGTVTVHVELNTTNRPHCPIIAADQAT